MRGLRDLVEKERLTVPGDLRGFGGEFLDISEARWIRQITKARGVGKRSRLLPALPASALAPSSTAASTPGLEELVLVLVLLELLAEAETTAALLAAFAAVATAISSAVAVTITISVAKTSSLLLATMLLAAVARFVGGTAVSARSIRRSAGGRSTLPLALYT
jgi:hypothetical protein